MERRSVLRLFVTAAGAVSVGSLAARRAQAADRVITVAYSQAELINDWRVTNQKDMEEHAKAAGVNFISVSADQDVAKQLADIQSLLARQPDVLIVAPLESVALAPAVTMCEDAGVPLVVIDRTLAAEPGKGMYRSEIVQSHYESGRIIARKAVELLQKKYGQPRGNVLHVQGQAGASPVIDSNKGWDDVMKPYPDIKTVATSDARFTKEGGIRVMQDFLQRFPAGTVDAVRSDDTDMTIGAIEAIKAAGRKELLGFIVAKGGKDTGIEAVVRGEIACETQIPPYFGAVAIPTAVKVAKGEAVAPRQNVPCKTFYADKADEAAAYLKEIHAKGLIF